jgi:hypothetical protein
LALNTYCQLFLGTDLVNSLDIDKCKELSAEITKAGVTLPLRCRFITYQAIAVDLARYRRYDELFAFFSTTAGNFPVDTPGLHHVTNAKLLDLILCQLVKAFTGKDQVRDSETIKRISVVSSHIMNTSGGIVISDDFKKSVLPFITAFALREDKNFDHQSASLKDLDKLIANDDCPSALLRLCTAASSWTALRAGIDRVISKWGADERERTSLKAFSVFVTTLREDGAAAMAQPVLKLFVHKLAVGRCIAHLRGTGKVRG